MSELHCLKQRLDSINGELAKHLGPASERQTDLPQRHQSLSVECIDFLIDLYPNCPRWASVAVDQINVQLERADDLAI